LLSRNKTQNSTVQLAEDNSGNHSIKMSRLKKKPRRMTRDDASLTEEEATVADQVTADDLSTDSLANIFGFLGGELLAKFLDSLTAQKILCKKDE
jgi:hypothetical protein